MFTTNCTAERKVSPDADRATLLIDSGASSTFLDPEIVPGLQDKVRAYKDLENRKLIETASNQALFGTGTGIVHSLSRQATIIDFRWILEQ